MDPRGGLLETELRMHLRALGAKMKVWLPPPLQDPLLGHESRLIFRLSPLHSWREINTRFSSPGKVEQADSSTPGREASESGCITDGLRAEGRHRVGGKAAW